MIYLVDDLLDLHLSEACKDPQHAAGVHAARVQHAVRA